MTGNRKLASKPFLASIFGDRTAIMFRMAFRNVFRQKRRSLYTSLAMFGGFALASLSIGLADGSYNQIIESFTRNNMGHIQIHGVGYLDKPTLYNNIEDYESIGQDAANISGVDGWTPRLYSGGLASVGTKTSGVQVIGIDPRREDEVLNFASKVKTGEMMPLEANHSALIGKGLTKSLNAEVGDSIIIVSQAADGSIANDIYRITGVVDSGDEISDRATMYLHIEDAQELFVLQGRVHEIIIVADKMGKVTELTEKVRGVIDTSKYSALPWQEFAKSF
ncbi:MAG: ABC transporter permease [bacterium]